MNIRIAGVHEESIVDGDGLRMTVFTQGCSHNCPGCHNPQTHDFSGGELVSVDSILDRANENELLNGITISGGEPFEQCPACIELASGAHDLGLDVWCYTGYTFDEIVNDPEKYPMLVEIDVLIDGPFVMEKRSMDLVFRGSSNQRIIDVQESLRRGRVVPFTGHEKLDGFCQSLAGREESV